MLTIFATQSLTHETAVILPLIPSAKFNKGELINVFGANHKTNYFSLHSVTRRLCFGCDATLSTSVYSKFLSMNSGVIWLRNIWYLVEDVPLNNSMAPKDS